MKEVINNTESSTHISVSNVNNTDSSTHISVSNVNCLELFYLGIQHSVLQNGFMCD